MLTNNFNIDKEILRYLDNNELSDFCKIKNRYVRRLCNSDSLWILRILDRYSYLAVDPTGTNEDILDSIATKYAQQNSEGPLFWRKLYNYISIIATRTVAKNYINVISKPNMNPVERDELLRTISFILENRQTINHILTSPIFLTPEIKDLLNERILPFLSQSITPYINSFILSTHGITTLDFLKYILISYLDINGGVSDKIYLMLYDDRFSKILEDGIIPDEKLTQEQRDALAQPNIISRINQEGQFIFDNIRNINPLDRRKYDNVKH